jgi:5-methylthioadenosine/S-adenosylhomocysteine deaminase
MKHCDTLIAPRWCIPVRPSGTVLEDHAVVVTDGRIVDILPQVVAAEQYQPSTRLERPSHALIPGLVNAHTHAAMTLLRGFADDLPLERWLAEGIWPAERRWAGAEFVRDGTMVAIAEMLRGGTTCFSDQYFFPEIVAETAIGMHMRAVIATPILDFPTAWANGPSEYLAKATDLVHDRYADHPLVSTAFAPHATYSVSDDTFRELRVLADQLDVPIQLHLHETAVEVAEAVRITGMRPIERLEQLGLLNASLMAVHGVHMTPEEIGRMASAGACLAHCPRSNLKLASGIAPVQQFLDAGVRVGLGTDGAASNNRLDMWSELQTAALVAKVQTGNAAALRAVDALAMATVGGAEALGIADLTGTIEAGKAADLTCVDLGQVATQPVYDPVSQLVYAASSDQVSDVWVAGRQLVADRELTHVDLPSILDRCEEWRSRIATTGAGE